ncbi:MAG: GNAT family N-acetyltransferase [Alphaproteobacteria bacterium]|nr:GNAT family N-acetyltransferase [Alphaproteobacteria bacterium]MDD9919978.1 GNAT family N-acetyltransferase [Alphaproteobacteria bacterium]
MATFSFTPLASSDFEQLARWLNAPHVRATYQKEPISLEEVTQEYTKKIDENSSVRCHIAWLDGAAVGFLQCYRVVDFPDYGQEIGKDSGITVDFFIGEAACLGKGYGKHMLQCYLQNVAFPTFKAEDTCWICHAEDNKAAIRCSQAVGFSVYGHVVEDGKPSVLLGLKKDDLT